jgi:hypothetical protein
MRGILNGGRVGKKEHEEIQEKGPWSRYRHLMKQGNQGSWRKAKLGHWK